MVDDHYAFQRLSNTNYAEWALHIEAVIIKKGLWVDIIDILVSDTLSDGSPKPPADVVMEFNTKLVSAGQKDVAVSRNTSLSKAPEKHGKPRIERRISLSPSPSSPSS